MRWSCGQRPLVRTEVKRKNMAVTFPDSIHPQHGLKVRFGYKPRATQYLDFFKITSGYPDYIFNPLNLVFQSSDELYQYLVNKGIIYDEVEVSDVGSRVEKEFTVVDTSKINDVEESRTKYLNEFKYYSINEVAEMLSFSRPTVYKAIKEGRLRAIRINGQMRIKHSDLTDYIKAEDK